MCLKQRGDVVRFAFQKDHPGRSGGDKSEGHPDAGRLVVAGQQKLAAEGRWRKADGLEGFLGSKDAGSWGRPGTGAAETHRTSDDLGASGHHSVRQESPEEAGLGCRP